jgi:hypothetical protein
MGIRPTKEFVILILVTKVTILGKLLLGNYLRGTTHYGHWSSGQGILAI